MSDFPANLNKLFNVLSAIVVAFTVTATAATVRTYVQNNTLKTPTTNVASADKHKNSYVQESVLSEHDQVDGNVGIGTTIPTTEEASTGTTIIGGSGENFVLNSSFESTSGNEPKFWDITDGQEKQYEPVTSRVRTGKKSLKVSPNGKVIRLVGKSSTNRSSKASYTLSASVWIDANNCNTFECSIILGLTDDHGTQSYHAETFVLNESIPTGTWVRLSATFENQLLTKLNPFIEFSNNLSTGSVIYIDDVKLELGETSTEYSPTNGMSETDGTVKGDKHGNIYPTNSGTGGLGLGGNVWKNLNLTNATIDEKGNFSTNGRVGINISEAITYLDIGGDMRLVGDQSDIEFTESADLIAGIGDTNNSGRVFGVFSGSALTQLLTVTTAGNVGIGSVAPNDKLEVAATSGNLGLRITNTGNTSSDYSAIRLYQGGSERGVIFTNQDDLYIRRGTGSSGNVLIADDAGNVGIGTTNPIAKLHIDAVGSGSSANTVALITHGDVNYNAYDDSDIEFAFINRSTGAITRRAMFIGNDGNVGIGSSTPKNILEVSKSDTTTAITDANTATTRIRNTSTTVDTLAGIQFSHGSYDASGDVMTAIMSKLVSDINYGAADLIFAVRESSTGYNPMEAMRISAGAFSSTVGIGVSAPTAKLDVRGNGIGTGYSFRTQDSSGTNRFVIQDDGNVGIGTTKPTQVLEVVGNTMINNGRLQWTNVSPVIESAWDTLDIYLDTDATVNADVFRIFNNVAVGAGSPLFVVNNAGNVGIGNTSPSQKLTVEGNYVGYAGSFFNDGNLDSHQGLFIQGCLDTNPTAACNFLEFRDGNGTVLGAIEGNGAGGVTNASAGADYAELFTGDKSDVGTGDVLGLTANGSVVKATLDTKLLGVYSATPATLGNWKEGWENDNSLVPVGLLGQLLVNVSTENGEITAGDFLTISSTPGVAMKANDSGHTIGKALESTSSDGSILAFINTEYYTTDELLIAASDDVRESVTVLTATYDEMFDKYGEDLEDYTSKLDETQEDVETLKSDVDSIMDFILNLMKILLMEDDKLKIGAPVDIEGDVSLDNVYVLGEVYIGELMISQDDGSLVVGKIKTDELEVRELTITKSIKIKGADVIGSGKIEAGSKEVEIETDEVRDESKIFVTPTSKTGGLVLIVSEKNDGESFKVEIEEEHDEDISFDWWMIKADEDE